MLEFITLLLPISIAAIVIADIMLFRRYEYVLVVDKSKVILMAGLKASLITAAVAFILTLFLMLISAINDVGVSLMVFILFFLSACLILGILALPWIVYGVYLLIKRILKK